MQVFGNGKRRRRIKDARPRPSEGQRWPIRSQQNGLAVLPSGAYIGPCHRLVRSEHTFTYFGASLGDRHNRHCSEQGQRPFSRLLDRVMHGYQEGHDQDRATDHANGGFVDAAVLICHW